VTRRPFIARIEADDPDALADAIGALERRGFTVSCPALDERMRLAKRDEFLAQALGLMTGTPWGQCVQLESQIRQFEALVWPKWCDRDTPPEGCSALRSLLFYAKVRTTADDRAAASEHHRETQPRL
jgi:hypothetical protein